MNLIKPFIGVSTLAVILFFTQTHLVSCQKQILNDTITIRDTLIVKDTVCNCYDLKNGLVAYYNFNNGNLNDSSGYNNNITFNNAVSTSDRHGLANNAYLFNGTSSYMKVENSTSLNPDTITLMATVKFNGFYSGLCNVSQILKKGPNDVAKGIYGLRAHQGGDCSSPIDITKQYAYGYFGDDQFNQAVAFDPTVFIKTGEWNTYVYTYDGKQAKFYINGELKSTVVQTAIFTPNTNSLFIGKMDNSQYPYWLNGAIDEIRIYKRSLCEAEVKLLTDSKN